MAKAKWTTKPNEASFAPRADGGFAASVPLYDNGAKQGNLEFTMTADRALSILWREAPGAIGLSNFQAWWKAD